MSTSTAFDRTAIERIVRDVVLNSLSASPGGATREKPQLVVSISARHLHLTDRDVTDAVLRGKGEQPKE